MKSKITRHTIHTLRTAGRAGRKRLAGLLLALALLATCPVSAEQRHTVVRGDTMWKIASRYEIGTAEIIQANPQVKNPDLIYPGDILAIPAIDTSILSYEQEVIRLVNVERAKAGLGALTEDWQLSRVARYKSQDMHDRGYFSHTSPTYGSPFDMMRSFGVTYRSAGENIAMGYATPAAVVNAWMNSAGHRANILNASFTKIGVGYVSSGNYWTQMFTG